MSDKTNIYVLKLEKGNYYVGKTDNIDKRISEQDLFSLISMITDVKNIKNNLKPEIDGKI